MVRFLPLLGGEIEFERIPSANPRSLAPTIVMLHEALGSISQWRDFPQRLSDGTGCPVLVYSRFGHGHSSPFREPRTGRFMHEEALEVLPALLDALNVDRPVLFGHSDGGSIALIHAGGSGRPVAGVVVLAPHIFVEPEAIAGIDAAMAAYESTDLARKLARHHRDADTVFRYWAETWRAESFRPWNIEGYVRAIECPVIAIQGVNDEYATLEQVERIGRLAKDAEVIEMEACGHSPHRDQPAAVLAAVVKMLDRVRG